MTTVGNAEPVCIGQKRGKNDLGNSINGMNNREWTHLAGVAAGVADGVGTSLSIVAKRVSNFSGFGLGRPDSRKGVNRSPVRLAARACNHQVKFLANAAF